MANIACIISQSGGADSVQLGTWTLLANGDSGLAFPRPDWADRTIQVFGTFGSGGTVLIEGSNDGTNWATLNDAFGTTMSVTSASIKQLAEATLYMRPRVSAGDGTTSITVIVCARKILPRSWSA
jgi:hypothetical protein